jgi:Photosynthesis system II assembly factor YCF48
MRMPLLAVIAGAIVLAGCGSVPASPAGARAAASADCPAVPVIPGYAAGIQFVSAATGWAVSQNAILATTDGGRNWAVQYSGRTDLTSVDFISSRVGWVVGSGTLLATSDGGEHWAALPESCPVIRSAPAGYQAMMIVQCASAGTAWALAAGELGTMEKEPYVAYHAGPAGTVPIFADLYFPQPGVHAQGPGPYSGPFSAISPSAAVFTGWCAPCGPGAGTAPQDLVTGSGALLTQEGDISGLNEPEAASFVSAQLGWVMGLVLDDRGTGVPLQRQRIVFTDDAGRTWHVQYTGPGLR